MLRFFNKLLRDFKTTRTAQGRRRAPRRANLQLECFEDRLVPTTVHFDPTQGQLFINATQNRLIVVEANGGQIQVFDNAQGGLVGQAPIADVNAAFVTVQGGDIIDFDDNNGLPFALGTNVTLQGSGTNNEMHLDGLLTLNDNETYVAGGLSSTPGEVTFSNRSGVPLVNFTLDSCITSVRDSIAINGFLDVQTSGTNVLLTSTLSLGNLAQTLSGMGEGGGDTLTYLNKGNVHLETFAFGANVHLNAVLPEPQETFFEVDMHGDQERTAIVDTPSGVLIFIHAEGNNQTVSVGANSNGMLIQGNSSTNVFLGQLQANGGAATTQGIQADVQVSGAKSLTIYDAGDTRPQNVTVTEKAIFGSGLFGNNNAKVRYSGVSTLTINTGQGADDYTVTPSQLGVRFGATINIVDYSITSFIADVFVDSASRLKLHLFNELTPPSAAKVFITPIGPIAGTVGFGGTPSNGFADVFFGDTVVSSQVTYVGFGVVI
jgi:hypothetical protein